MRHWEDPVIWDGHLAQCGAMFDISRRLPQKVNRLPLSAAPFFDSDLMFSPEAWPMLSSLAALHGDDEVHFLTHEPGAAYFLESVARYGGFTLSTSMQADAYREALYGPTMHGSPGTIGYVGEVASVFGDSLAWGIWVERNVAAVVTSARPSALGEWALNHGPLLTVEDALDDFLELNIGPGDSRVRRELKKNYGSFT